MFGGKKKKSERQWLLDVKARAKPIRALRLRMAAGALAISAGIVLTLFVSWKGGEWLMDRCVYNNPAFCITRIDIESDGIIPLEQIRAWASVSKGQNLLALDLPRIKRHLELVPMIEAASVERSLPDRLLIRVHEREPIARVAIFSKRSGDGLLEASAIYLDEHGMVVPPVLRTLNSGAFDAATRYLPTITGASAIVFRPGHPVESREVLAALRWIRSFEKSEMAGRVDIRTIDVSSPTSLLVVTEQDNEISFAYNGFDTQLARWRKIHDFGSGRGRVLASLDLAVTNYVPALWLDLTNAAPPIARPVQSSPYRKRNV
jgi:hypothetical protein